MYLQDGFLYTGNNGASGFMITASQWSGEAVLPMRPPIYIPPGGSIKQTDFGLENRVNSLIKGDITKTVDLILYVTSSNNKLFSARFQYEIYIEQGKKEIHSKLLFISKVG
jgi:hypothetical protein